MTRSARPLLASCLAATVASVSGLVIGAEGVEAQQELVNVKTANQVLSAVWTRQPDSYTLQVVIDRSMPRVMMDIREAAKLLPPTPSRPQPQPIPNWPVPNEQDDAFGNPDRGSAFIANTIANLRGLNASPCGRTLSSTDGRRTVPGVPPQTPVAVPLPPGFKDHRVEVWLLNAAGTQIQTASYNCDDPGRSSPDRNDFTISYGYSVADGAQAVAAAVRIGEAFYIERLQPLAAPAVPLTAPALQ
jgi:hypothetical protein